MATDTAAAGGGSLDGAIAPMGTTGPRAGSLAGAGGHTAVEGGGGTGGIHGMDGAGGRAAGLVRPGRVYHPPFRNTWWLRNRRYFLFMLRDFSAAPIALWLLWLLLQASRARGEGAAAAYRAPQSPWLIALSVICLAFALLHSVTWLNLSGVILRVPLGERDLNPRLVTAANYAVWALATLVVGGLLIAWGR